MVSKLQDLSDDKVAEEIKRTYFRTCKTKVDGRFGS